MSHLSEDDLLLFAYGELDDAEVAAHLGACGECRARLQTIERPRVAVDWALGERASRSWRWAGVGAALAAAAVLAAVLLMRGTPPGPAERMWPPPAVSSSTAGYLAGGMNVLLIDAQLTRLEQERYYGLPD